MQFKFCLFNFDSISLLMTIRLPNKLILAKIGSSVSLLGRVACYPPGGFTPELNKVALHSHVLCTLMRLDTKVIIGSGEFIKNRNTATEDGWSWRVFSHPATTNMPAKTRPTALQSSDALFEAVHKADPRRFPSPNRYSMHTVSLLLLIYCSGAGELWRQ